MMRSVLFFAVVLAGSAAQADECRVGSASLRAEDGRVFRVIGAGSGSAKVQGVSTGRFVMKGTVNGRETFIETQKIAGSSATETSYDGPLRDGFGKPHWLKRGNAFGYDDGDALTVYEGPLDGKWTFTCR